MRDKLEWCVTNFHSTSSHPPTHYPRSHALIHSSSAYGEQRTSSEWTACGKGGDGLNKKITWLVKWSRKKILIVEYDLVSLLWYKQIVGVSSATAIGPASYQLEHSLTIKSWITRTHLQWQEKKNWQGEKLEECLAPLLISSIKSFSQSFLPCHETNT